MAEFSSFKKCFDCPPNPEEDIPSQKTSMYYSQNDDALLLAFECFEENIFKLKKTNTSYPRKPEVLPVTNPDDYVEVLLDLKHDHKNYLHVLVNPAGRVYASVGCSSRNNFWSRGIIFEGEVYASIDYEKRRWTIMMSLPFKWLKKYGMPDGECIIGFAANRHRTAGGNSELYFSAPYTLSHTTQWTSSIVFEPHWFGHFHFASDKTGKCQPGKIIETRHAELEKEARNENFDFPEYNSRIFPAPASEKCAAAQTFTNPKFNGKSLRILTPFDNKHIEKENNFLPEISKMRGYNFSLKCQGEDCIIDRKIKPLLFEDSRLHTALRQIEILNEKNENLLTECKIKCSLDDFFIENLESLRTADENAAFFLNQKSYPSSFELEFVFRYPEILKKINIKHGIEKDNCRYYILANFKISFISPDKTLEIPVRLKEKDDGDFSIRDLPEGRFDSVKIIIHSQEFSDRKYSADDAWQWWFRGETWHGTDMEKLEKTLAECPFFIKYRRYGMGDFISENRRMAQVEKLAAESLMNKFSNTFLGFWIPELESDIWSEATGVLQDKAWLRHPDELPDFPPDRVESEKTLKDIFNLQKEYLHNKVFAMCSWRCMDHYALEYGGLFPAIEVSSNGVTSQQIQLAFTRGAARQYKRFWAYYLAVMFGQGTTEYINCSKSPAIWNRSAESGASLSLFKRMLYHGYFAGASLMELEQPSSVFAIDRNGKTILSEHGKVYKTFTEYVSSDKNRGTHFASSAIMLDYHHGFSPCYHTEFAFGRSGLQSWLRTPYTDFDYFVKELFYTIFPWTRQRIERNGYCLVNTPFGDVFDVLVNTGSFDKDFLSNYPAIVLVPGIAKLESIKNTLISYVELGGKILTDQITCRKLFDTSTGDVIFEKDNFRIDKINSGSGSIFSFSPNTPLSDKKKLEPAFGEFLFALTKELTPVKVTGDIQYILNKGPNGWDVLLMNNKGVFHRAYENTEYRKGSENVHVVFPDDTLEICSPLTGEKFSSSVISVEVDNGDIKILRSHNRKG